MEADFATLIRDASPDALMVLGAEGEVLHWNSAAARIYRYASEEAQGQSVSALIAAPGHEAAQAGLLHDVLAHGHATLECVRRTKTGALIYADISCKRVAGPAGPLLIAAERDVTALKVQRELRLMQAKFGELLDAAPDGMIITAPIGHILLANAQACHLFGYTTREFNGMAVELLLPESYRGGHVRHRAGYFAQPRPRAMGSDLQLAGRRHDGSEFPLEISLSPVEVEGNPYVISAIRDISERKRFQEELQRKNLELATANAAKDRFLASMSHELRTPLNGIIGFTGTLLMALPGPLNAQQGRQLEIVKSSADHLLALINDLLDVARIEAGKLRLTVAPVGINALIEGVAATMRPQAERKGLDFCLHLPKEDYALHTDERALRQIVINLLGNAIKFTERGSIHLSMCKITRDTAAYLRLEIADTGVGVREEDRVRLAASSQQTRAGELY